MFKFRNPGNTAWNFTVNRPVDAAEAAAAIEIDNTDPDYVLAQQPKPPTQDQLDAAAAKANVKLMALRSMSPAQVSEWVDANVTNPAQEQDAIKTLAVAVSVLARRL